MLVIDRKTGRLITATPIPEEQRRELWSMALKAEAEIIHQRMMKGKEVGDDVGEAGSM